LTNFAQGQSKPAQLKNVLPQDTPLLY